MTVPLVTRRKLMKVSLETVQGTAVAGTAHAFITECNINPDETAEDRKPHGASAGNAPSSPGELTGTCSFQVELRSNGATALDAGLEVLLQGCGLKLTAGVYAPTTIIADQKTITIDVFEDGQKKQIYGAMGNVTIEGTAAKRIMCRFEFKGVWLTPVAAALPVVVPSRVLPMRLAGATLTCHGQSSMISKFTFNPQMVTKAREDVSKAAAIGHMIITDRNPTIGMDPEAELPAGHDAYGIWQAGTEAAISLAMTDGTKTLTLAGAKLEYRQVTEGDRDGILTHELNGQFNINADTDDDFTLTVS